MRPHPWTILSNHIAVLSIHNALLSIHNALLSIHNTLCVYTSSLEYTHWLPYIRHRSPHLPLSVPAECDGEPALYDELKEVWASLKQMHGSRVWETLENALREAQKTLKSRCVD